MIEESDASKAEAARLLAQPVPDAAGTRTALARARADDIRVRGVVEDRAVGYAATLPQADRQRIADALVSRMRRREP